MEGTSEGRGGESEETGEREHIIFQTASSLPSSAWRHAFTTSSSSAPIFLKSISVETKRHSGVKKNSLSSLFQLPHLFLSVWGDFLLKPGVWKSVFVAAECINVLLMQIYCVHIISTQIECFIWKWLKAALLPLSAPVILCINISVWMVPLPLFHSLSSSEGTAVKSPALKAFMSV